MTKLKRVLFICYANTCRSPAAENFARYYAKKYNLKDIVFTSAGWHDAFNYAQPETINYVQEKCSIDMSSFRPKIITRELIEKQDLIIGMEKYQLLKVRKKFKDLRDKLKDKMFTLKQFNGAYKRDLNIPDPYMTGIENYNSILKIVDDNVELLVKNLLKLTNPSNMEQF